MPIFKVIGLATATEPQQTTNHHHHATRQPEKPLNHKPTNPLNQKTNKPIILVPTRSKSNLHRTHAIKTPTEWSPHRSKLDLHGTSEPTRSKPHWNETHAIKTRSPYTLIKTPISIEPTLIKTPLEATWSSSADQNPIETHPKSKPTSPRRSVNGAVNLLWRRWRWGRAWVWRRLIGWSVNGAVDLLRRGFGFFVFCSELKTEERDKDRRKGKEGIKNGLKNYYLIR